MSRIFAVLWLALVLAAGGHVLWRSAGGLPFQTDLMALLPAEHQEPVVQRAKDALAKSMARRIVVLVGHADRATARTASAALGRSLVEAGVVALDAATSDPNAIQRLGATYFPYRSGLLSEADRDRLRADRGDDIVNRALRQVYGFVGMVDSRLLANDPFLLFPEFLKGLPGASGKAALDEGLLTIQDGGRTWILLSGELVGEPYALAFQDRFQEAWDAANTHGDLRAPGLSLLRTGVIFHARTGASEAIGEASTIATCSLVATTLLLLVAFRSLMPLLLGVLSVVVGLVAALSVSLLVFGRPHVSVLLFGASLIGVTSDYCLHYFAQVFSRRTAPADRLRHILPGLILGAATTILGYGVLAVAPYPGLRQAAVFSAIGVFASFVTVLLWFPLLDRERSRPVPRAWSRLSSLVSLAWFDERTRLLRFGLAAVMVLAAASGFVRLAPNDDVRRQQALSPQLVAEQAEVLRLTGFDVSAQFFVVEGRDDEQALAREETLNSRLAAAAGRGAIAGWQSPASFVPSVERQREDRRLVEGLVASHLGTYRASLGMPPSPPDAKPPDFLTLRAVRDTHLMPFLDTLVLDDSSGGALHAVGLKGVTDPGKVRDAATGIQGVRFVDPAADITALLGKYRERAVWLLAISAALMIPMLAIRHGFARSLRIMTPPLTAVVLAPAVLGLAGVPFTFFVAMALVLVLSIGVDYSIFCAETSGGDPVTVAALTLATLTTLLSFGLLAFSRVEAVHAFGLTMLVGIGIAFLLAPWAAPRTTMQARPRIV